MKFTIDVTGFIRSTHRLKKDGNFVQVDENSSDKGILENDLVFDDFFNAYAFKEKLDEITVDGAKMKVNPIISNLMDPIVDVRPHRTRKPTQTLFSREQVKKAILSGNDSLDNSLIVDTEGFVRLMPFNQAKKYPYAVRFETFVAGNGYVGEDTSLDDLEDTYLALLDSWSIHLFSHNRIYRDYPAERTEEEVKKEILEALNQWD